MTDTLPTTAESYFTLPVTTDTYLSLIRHELSDPVAKAAFIEAMVCVHDDNRSADGMVLNGRPMTRRSYERWIDNLQDAIGVVAVCDVRRAGRLTIGYGLAQRIGSSIAIDCIVPSVRSRESSVGPFGPLTVRAALASALVDRSDIEESVRDPHGSLARTLVPEQQRRDSLVQPETVEAVRAALDAAHPDLKDLFMAGRLSYTEYVGWQPLQK